MKCNRSVVLKKAFAFSNSILNYMQSTMILLLFLANLSFVILYSCSYIPEKFSNESIKDFTAIVNNVMTSSSKNDFKESFITLDSKSINAQLNNLDASYKISKVSDDAIKFTIISNHRHMNYIIDDSGIIYNYPSYGIAWFLFILRGIFIQSLLSVALTVFVFLVVYVREASYKKLNPPSPVEETPPEYFEENVIQISKYINNKNAEKSDSIIIH